MIHLPLLLAIKSNAGKALDTSVEGARDIDTSSQLAAKNVNKVDSHIYKKKVVQLSCLVAKKTIMIQDLERKVSLLWGQMHNQGDMHSDGPPLDHVISTLIYAVLPWMLLQSFVYWYYTVD